MPKKRSASFIWILIIIVIASLICYNLYVNYHNKKAEEQRWLITSCSQDQDCVMKSFNDYACGDWSGCFNKQEEPKNDILFKFQPRFGLHCDPNFNCQNPGTCKCEEGRCVEDCEVIP